jgi:hypothetical protein
METARGLLPLPARTGATINQHQLTGCGSMSDREQVLKFRIGQESRRVLASWKFQYDHSFRSPNALHRYGFRALNNVPSAMLSNKRRHFLDVLSKRFQIMDREIEHKIGFHR